MEDSVALKRYLDRHIEPALPEAPANNPGWRHVLVIPCYDEAPTLLERLQALPTAAGRVLVILVLNRPDSSDDPLVNEALREAIRKRAPGPDNRAIGDQLVPLNPGIDLFLLDLEKTGGPTPAAQGVGLARKSGCDLALKWMHQGYIAATWIGSTDADALLPPDYFSRLEQLPRDAVAAVFPFLHRPGKDADCNAATRLYELRLHHYVLGLEYAGSPYAYHTLGSCLAVHADAYSKVRGFPRRAGGEDFYLLNKLAKLGPVVRSQGLCIELESRASHRVPFGTGPAVARIGASATPAELALFYHPACFQALRELLAALPALAEQESLELGAILADNSLTAEMRTAVLRCLEQMGLASAVSHCRRQSTSPEQFLRQFHQWFDGFRSLKFIHGMRDAGWPDQTLAQLRNLKPEFWPVTALQENPPDSEAIRHQFGWISPRRAYY